MTEIEIKAHVYDRQTLINQLNKIAKFSHNVIRDDIYYKKENKSIRIRKETSGDKVSYLLTYKRKEIIKDNLGIPTEVNDENECEISNPETIITFLQDTGYEINLKKHKEVIDWNYHIEEFNCDAKYELCNVPPLGDFLEIEILSSTSDKKTVTLLQSQLKNLLEIAGISLSCIEEQYYSTMLLKANQNQK